MTDHEPRPVRPLRGERVYLRPIEPEDAELVHGWFLDARVLSWMGETPISLARRRRAYQSSVDADDAFRFVICRLEDDEPVGRTDLFDIDSHHGSAEFGITIGDPALWGRGYGTDAVNALVDFAFGQLRLERMCLGTDPRNARAQAAYARAGFREEGRLRNAYFQDGEYVDEVRMSLLRAEWLALPRAKSWDLVDGAVHGDRR
jgi:RimJ/RimL family protein N-acetyltransferase